MGAPLVVGRVGGAHGLDGGFEVHLFHAGSSTLRPHLRVGLRHDDGACVQAVVSRVARKPGAEVVRLWLEGVNDRDTAEKLRGTTLEIERADLPALEEGELWLADLVGLAVRDQSGRALGRVVGVSTNTAQDLLVVDHEGVEWLVPVLPQFIVTIDEAGIEADVPEGMLPPALGKEGP